MKATKPSKVVKQRRTRKNDTPSSRKHHFEGFSQRISKLRIDPVRRTRRAVGAEGSHELERDGSYFRTFLEEQVDLNLSENFRAFTKEVAPLTESLPMVLHYEDKIMDILKKYIEKEDSLSLEPLLGLLAHFAHDLDFRFEKHFQRAVAAVAQVAAKHADVEVIEWSFTCLAFLFKYLSRLLTPNLVPLYDLMAPFLGKERQKPFVIRFAAESMSFLVRKAGGMYEKNREPLELIVKHMIQDYSATMNTTPGDLYEQGLMTLFTESIKGIQGTLHSGGNAVLLCLISRCFDRSASESERHHATKIMTGALISIMHHTDAETFEPILKAVFDFTGFSDGKAAQDEIDIANHLLFTVAATRKGTRISDWPTFVARLMNLFRLVNERSQEFEASSTIALLNTLAVVFQTAPMPTILPHVSIFDVIVKAPWKQHFLAFCNVFAQLGRERFQTLLLSHLQRFIVSHWEEDEATLCCLLPTLAHEGLFWKTSLQCPAPWQSKMAKNYKTAAQSRQVEAEDKLALYNGELANLRSAQAHGKYPDEVLANVRKMLDNTCKKLVSSQQLDRSDLFTLGQAFKYLTDMTGGLDKEDKGSKDLFEKLCTHAKHVKGLVPFWEALLAVLKSKDSGLTFTGPHIDSLLETAISYLSTPSHELRRVSLEIISTIYSNRGEEIPDLLTVAISIEDTPPNVQTMRFISAQIRRFALGYSNVQSDSIMAKLIPTYCMGILHFRLAQAWDDAVQTLSEIWQVGQAEDVIFEIISSWLEEAAEQETLEDAPPRTMDTEIGHVSSDFECSNLLMLEKTCQSAVAMLEDPLDELQRRFSWDHKLTPFTSLEDRSQALRVLHKIPQLAEKRSRLLAPVLLRWAGAVEEDQTGTEEAEGQRWSRKDQKAMLAVFAQFQNPRVLFRAGEVHDALLNLLSNGDVEIQKSALTAILSWKTPGVKRYEERLTNILDEARFREEISVFLRLDQEEAIRLEDLPELMSVLLRLLYGRAVTRAGSASGKRGQQTRRKAIFVALSKFPESVLAHFIDIALGQFATAKPIRDGELAQDILKAFTVPQRKQFGLLNMVEDMLNTLGDELQPFAHSLANCVLICLLKSSRVISTPTDSDEETVEDANPTSLDRAIRQSAYHCLIQLFSTCTEVAWGPYARVIMHELIGPRLEKFPIETAQSISGILRVFSTWSSSLPMSRFLVEFYPETLQKIAETITVPSAKFQVKLFIVQNIFSKLLDLSADDDTVTSTILAPNAGYLVTQLGDLLRQNPPKELLDASVLCVSRLAPLVKDPKDVAKVLDVATFLLRQPSKAVHYTTKRDLLESMRHLIPKAAEELSDPAHFDPVFEAICPLFSFFRDRESRLLLCTVLKTLADIKESLQEVASLCEDLNSWSASRLDEPDFTRRAQAFATISDEKYSTFTEQQWIPLVYNMIYYIKDNEELAIRTSASLALRRYIEASGDDGTFRSDVFEAFTSTALIPGLQTGMRELSELVRSEFLAVLAHLIRCFPTWAPVSDMDVLLAGGDEEASFFTNILHIQQHRRLRALRRLATEARAGKISSTNVSTMFIPLMEHFVFDPSKDESDHNLAAETVHTLGALSECLEWQQYRSTLNRFISYRTSKPDLEKTVLRLVSSVIDGLHRASGVAADTEMTDANADDAEPGAGGRLKATLPPKPKLSNEINKHFLPPLTEFLHLKDESTVSLRVPVAVSVIKLLLVLPQEDIPTKLPSVLMDLCHVLRSRNQDARDMTRKTLAQITALLGPPYFGFILKELRSALQRGYQLHVLSFTMHSIFVENESKFQPGDLDHCLSDIISIIMDDIFGATGQEKDAEEYISKMKEVKSSKSFDSMELIAKITTLQHLSELIRPIQNLLSEKLDLKTVKKIDELLRRLGLGTTQNEAVNDRDTLIFCYEIIQQVYNANAAAASGSRPAMDDYKIRKYLIQMKGANKSSNKGATSSYIFKLTRFALDLLRSVLQRHDALKTPANLAGFLPILGDSLIGGQEEVQMSAVRLLTAIIKVPSPQIESNATVYAREAVNIIRAAPSTTTELAQAALKLLSAVIRERPAAKIKETDMAYILKRVKPDLEEPDRQGVIFNFLKAVLSRKVVITEVYEVLDTVAAIMVTNQTRTARDLARGIYFQFIMEYPQGKDRFAKQVGFLVKNLEYKYIEGRQSMLELLHLLLSKVQGDSIQELASMLFVPLVMVLVNDESPDCREMAGALIGKIFERADEERMKNFLALMRTWLEQDEQVLLRRIALQCWATYLATGQVQAKDVTLLIKQLSPILETEAQEEWELRYYGLQLLAKLSETVPETVLSTKLKSLWQRVFRSLLFPHTWVKLSAAKLVGLLFGDVASTNAQTEQGLAALPLRGSGGLELTEQDLRQLCNASMRILKFAGVTEQLATQTIRNLIFLGRCFSANEMVWQIPGSDNAATSDGSVDGEGAEESEDDEDDADAEPASSETRTALAHLFGGLSGILRRDFTSLRAPALVPKTAALQCIAALINALPVPSLQPSLQTLLLPLTHLTDPSIPAPSSADPAFNENYKTLVNLSTEVQGLLQTKLGTSEYVAVMGKVQEIVRERREGRRRKRRIEAVAEPGRWEAEKRRRYENKRSKRKEKGMEARGRRRGW